MDTSSGNTRQVLHRPTPNFSFKELFNVDVDQDPCNDQYYTADVHYQQSYFDPSYQDQYYEIYSQEHSDNPQTCEPEQSTSNEINALEENFQSLDSKQPYS